MLYQYGARQRGPVHLFMEGISGENKLMSTPALDSRNSMGTPYQAANTPARVTLLVATVSLWLVIVDWLRPGGLKPVPRVVIGLLMGFAGMALLVGPARLGGSERVDPRGAAVLVIASLAWACGSLYSKHGGMPSSAMLGVAITLRTAVAAAIILTAVILVITAPHREPAPITRPVPAPGEG